MTTKAEATQLANDRPMSLDDDLYQWAVDAEELLRRWPAAPQPEPVATVVSWTNGSYWRNYQLDWHKDVEAGAKLYDAPPAAPADMVMVPREPTQAMLDAMQSSGWMPGNYRAMIAAAPAPAVPLTDADIDRIADAVPVDEIDVHITTWHRRFARAVLAAAPAVPCEHRLAKYDITFTQGTCQDCGAKWTASQGWSAAPAVPLTDADIDRIADAVPVDEIDVHITTWHRRFARAVLAAAPAVPVPLTDDQIDEIWDGSFDSADPKRQLSFRQIITRAIEAHHGIGGSNG